MIVRKGNLEVIIDNELNFQEHIGTQVKQANKLLGIIKRSFTYLDKEMFITLYKILVRPHLKYRSNIWSVLYKNEDVLLENVQRRATKLVRNIANFDYPTIF